MFGVLQQTLKRNLVDTFADCKKNKKLHTYREGIATLIQVLGLRDFLVRGVHKKREVFFNKGWRFESIDQVFSAANIATLVASVPQDERHNLYFTVADCFEEQEIRAKSRRLKEQWVIPFDIDDIHISSEDNAHADAEKVARCALKAIGVSWDDAGVIFSGHGVQFFIKLKEPILSTDFFDTYRLQYAAVCATIQSALLQSGVAGKVDTSVFSGARLMRLPSTLNIKPGKVTRTSHLLSPGINAVDFDLVKLSGLTEFSRPEHISDEVLKNYPKPDTKAVLEGCEFLRHCQQHAAQVKEPQWYAQISVTSRLDDGVDLTHQLSQAHPKYDSYETDLKIEQALKNSGPRTCRNIESLWDGCKNCKYYNKVSSPIMIKGEDYIASSDFGFRERKMTDKGVKAGKPVYTDLVKQFAVEHPFKTIAGSAQTYVYKDTHWLPLLEEFIKEWVLDKVKPSPSVAELNEFVGLLKSHNVINHSWLTDSTDRMMNFKNCVLNMESLEVGPHNPKYGFTNTLPFDYDPRASAPRWEKFLLEIMSGDADMALLLKEFGGYAISGDRYWMHRALVLIGDGANGKSVYMEMLAAVVGKGAYSAIPMQTLNNPQSRYNLVNKLFNYSEETSVRAFADSEIFKTLSAGGVYEVKQLYAQPFELENNTKIIMAANNTPTSKDQSHGLYRRMLIVHFNKRFIEGADDHDFFLKDKLKLELPGICNSLIKAYREMKARGCFSADTKTKATMQEYINEADNVRRFADERIDFTPDDNALVPVDELYQSYKDYCMFIEEKPLNNVHFSKHLFKIFPELSAGRSTTRVQGKVARVLKGVKLFKEF